MSFQSESERDEPSESRDNEIHIDEIFSLVLQTDEPTRPNSVHLNEGLDTERDSSFTTSSAETDDGTNSASSPLQGNDSTIVSEQGMLPHSQAIAEILEPQNEERINHRRSRQHIHSRSDSPTSRSFIRDRTNPDQESVNLLPESQVETEAGFPVGIGRHMEAANPVRDDMETLARDNEHGELETPVDAEGRTLQREQMITTGQGRPQRHQTRFTETALNGRQPSLSREPYRGPQTSWNRSNGRGQFERHVRANRRSGTSSAYSLPRNGSNRGGFFQGDRSARISANDRWYEWPDDTILGLEALQQRIDSFLDDDEAYYSQFNHGNTLGTMRRFPPTANTNAHDVPRGEYENQLHLIDEMGGSVNRNATMEEIIGTESRTYATNGTAGSSCEQERGHLVRTSVGSTRENASGETCRICLSTFKSEDIVKVLPCKHMFHSICVDRWLTINRLCPLCRRSIRHEEH